MMNIILKSFKLKTNILFLGFLVVLISCGGGSDDPDGPIDPGGTIPPPQPDETFETLVWSDEFDGDKLGLQWQWHSQQV